MDLHRLLELSDGAPAHSVTAMRTVNVASLQGACGAHGLSTRAAGTFARPATAIGESPFPPTVLWCR